MVGTVLVLFVLPSFFTETHRLAADLLHAMPYPAFQRLARITLAGPRPTHHPATVAGAWITYALWPLAVTLATAVAPRRDH
ncbi:hypothetical protein [Kitasatospora camelliae]|uniref:ABC-2 type transport system permease protein n=1 Tax=Kitasatospora camelliae TaxID=3156397 RepID=A0AAU8JNT7_9ACTN